MSLGVTNATFWPVFMVQAELCRGSALVRSLSGHHLRTVAEGAGAPCIYCNATAGDLRYPLGEAADSGEPSAAMRFLAIRLDTADARD